MNKLVARGITIPFFLIGTLLGVLAYIGTVLWVSAEKSANGIADWVNRNL